MADETPELPEPTEISAEDAVGAQETPSEAQQEREQELVENPVAEGANDEPAAEEAPADEPADDTPRVKPAIPGMDLAPDIVFEGEDPLKGREGEWSEEDGEEPTASGEGDDDIAPQPIAETSISLAAGARYAATGKRKTAVARVILRPGKGEYSINGRTLEQHFPRETLQRNISQALETVGLETRMDVVASIHGGGVTAQAGALRHGISKALVDADPNLRSELKRRGFLTRDARVKERKKAGLKKARKKPQFSKR
jgi:small subunit ribosomal protein S9